MIRFLTLPFDLGFSELVQKLCGSESNSGYSLLDYIFYAITILGDEMAFIAVAALIYWCVDKRWGYKFITVYIFGSSMNEVVKHIFKVARPYNHESGRIRSIFGKTEGYSFPSGHSQNIANMSTQFGIKFRGNKKIYIVGAIITFLVAFSRIYLGQHYLTDVVVGVAFGVGLAFLFSFLFELAGDKEEWLFIIFVPILCGLMFIYNKNILLAAGSFMSVSIGYFLEKRFVGYTIQGAWWQRGIIYLVGISVALALKEGLKMAFNTDNLYILYFLRYFIVGIWAAFLAPICFKYLQKILKKLPDKKAENGSANE